MEYTGRKTREISFPLGGIGTGCVGLAGNGRLIDWEIFGRPNKGGRNPYTFFAVKAEAEGEVLDARVLNGDLQPPYMGEYVKEPFHGYGHGPFRDTMAGMPHFDEVAFVGEYPLAEIRFGDMDFPGNVTLRAFNPMIPLNDRDSTIPGAFFEYEVTNTTQAAVDYTFCLAAANTFARQRCVNRYGEAKGAKMILLTTDELEGDALEYGQLCIATDEAEVSYQEYWYRGIWFDNVSVFWEDFTRPGAFANRSYPADAKWGATDNASLAARVSVASGETRRVRFALTWYFPNMHNYWNPEQAVKDGGQPTVWKHYYASLFGGADDCARYALGEWDRLYRETAAFHDALFASTLPPEILDAVSANISILKSPTCLRLEDGSFYAFEGSHCHDGSCEGSCTHVWNYAQALPFLYPSLERSMRSLHYRYNQNPDGGMAFRMMLPVGRERTDFRPCVDGQFGDVVKAYRDWKISGDTDWLRSIWESIKRSIDFAWSPDNVDRWDADKDGVLEGRQHHTLDMELYGPNAWLTGFYLAALKAAAEMAEHLGEPDKAGEYAELYARGSAWVDQNLFNGEYFEQKMDLSDGSILTPYLEDPGAPENSRVYKNYWNPEARELKYQMGEGCAADQTLAQWHANLCGLGRIFDEDKTRASLQAIYRHNFKKSMRRHANPARLYAVNGEAGTTICSWPKGKRKPVVPAPYSEEVWSGCEYQVAAQMIAEDMVSEGLELVRAVRGRYDGEKRNPWNEMECGSNYARSMASYSLLLSYSGFGFDVNAGSLSFAPVTGGEGFACFWSLDSGWGTVRIEKDNLTLDVRYGKLDVSKIMVYDRVIFKAPDGKPRTIKAGESASFAR